MTLHDIETLASKEDNISKKVRELREQQKYLDENIQASLDEAINIMEQSLNAVRMKMYGDFGDHSAICTTALKVMFIKMDTDTEGPLIVLIFWQMKTHIYYKIHYIGK